MRLPLFFVLVLGFALVAAGCEVYKYDNDVFSCVTSNGKIQVELYVYRDTDQTDRDVVTARLLAACRAARAAVDHPTSSHTSGGTITP